MRQMTAIDPNRSITELKSGRSTLTVFGREILGSLECVGQVVYADPRKNP
jgi:hypothetical protein